MSNANDHKEKDWWDKCNIIIKVLIPLVIAYVGYSFNSSIKKKDINFGMITVAVEILKENPDDSKNKELRQWAMTIIDNLSEVKLPKKAKDELKTTALPDTIYFRSGSTIYFGPQEYWKQEDWKSGVNRYHENKKEKEKKP